MILHDQHVHSNYSDDSSELLENHYQKATSAGCKYFITTEHIDFNPSMSDHDWLCDFDKLINHLNKLKKEDTPIPLLGVEMGYRNDYLEEINQILNSYDFDLINLSVHDSGKYEYYFVDNVKALGIEQMTKLYYNQVLEAIMMVPKFNVLSHLDYYFKTVYKIDKTARFLDDIDLIKPILNEIIKKGKALEINVKVQNALPESHLRDFLKLYKDLGGTKLTLSTDAHSSNRYLEHFDKYVRIIKESGFNYLCYYIKQKEYHYDI